MAVEVLRRVLLKAAHRFVVQALRQADRVGGGHQHDLAPEQSGGFSSLQPGAQVVRGEHAGQLFGVQAGLDVNLQTGAALAKMKAA